MEALSRLNSVLFKIIKEIMIIIGFFLIALTFIGVILRYAFGISIIWAYEVSMMLLVWVSFLGAAIAVQTKSHVNFDLLLSKIPEKTRKWIVLLKDIIILAFLVIGTYYGYKVFRQTMRQSMQTINLPVGLLYLALPVGFIPMILFFIEEALTEFTSNAQKIDRGGKK
ncbi:MAG TPA: TRAP transporter small permease [Rectinema sp.]|nr:TRAP transporter small permease [Rectinema sp.]